MFQILVSILKKPKNLIIWILGSAITFFFLRILPQLYIVRDFLGLETVSFSRKYEIIYDYSFGAYSSHNPFELGLTIILSVVFVLNIILFVIYARRQARMLSGKSLAASLSGMILGFFGVGCLSCGVIILAPLLTFIGLGSYLNTVSEYAQWLSITGVMIIIISVIYLLKKLNEPLICKP